MTAMLGRVEPNGQFRARLLECSTKSIYNPQAGGSFLSRDATVPIFGDKITPYVQRPRAGEVSECKV